MLINYFTCDPLTQIYKAACTIDGKRQVLPVWEQNGRFFVLTGTAMHGDLTRHDFTFKQDAVFRLFDKGKEYVSGFDASGF